jgi:hypothetical protein
MKNIYTNHCGDPRCLRCFIAFKPYPRMRLYFLIVLFFAAVIAASEYLSKS